MKLNVRKKFFPVRVVGHWNRLLREPVEEVSILSEWEHCPTAIYLKFKLDHSCMCWNGCTWNWCRRTLLCPSQDMSAWTACCNSTVVRKKKQHLTLICFVRNILGFICSMSKSGSDEFKYYVRASGANTHKSKRILS